MATPHDTVAQASSQSPPRLSDWPLLVRECCFTGRQAQRVHVLQRKFGSNGRSLQRQPNNRC